MVRLSDLNRRFYAEHAEDFADTRPRLADGVQRVLARVPPGASVLEVGCGDGKAGRALARAGVGVYVGVDESAAMVGRARRHTGTTNDRRQTTVETKGDEGAGEQGGRGAREQESEEAGETREVSGVEHEMEREALNNSDSVVSAVGRRSSVVFMRADITQRGWHVTLPAGLYDWVLAFAVLHHIPGAARRASVLRDLARRLAAGGRLAMANWQMTRSERLRRRVRPWAEVGINEADVEPGDFLLSWERGGRHGLRYVHVIEAAEAEALATAAGLRVTEVFEADGVTGDLAEYVEMKLAADHDLTEQA